MPDLVPVHGGLSEPVCRTVPAEEIDGFLARAERLMKIPVSDADLSTVYRFGDGGLSPLEGPMDGGTFERVLDESVIEREGTRYAWTIPLALPVTEAMARRLGPGEEAALVNSQGHVVATLVVSDVFPWDKRKYLARVYLTDRTDHPGGDMVLVGDADKTHLLGGRIRVLPQPKDPRFGKYLLTPREVRALLAEKGWERAVAFQTRNPLHRAHEYALVYGLETLLRQGYNAGACLNPLIGETKGDDVHADVRMHTYEALIESRALGEGDSDPELWGPRGESVPDRVILLHTPDTQVLLRRIAQRGREEESGITRDFLRGLNGYYETFAQVARRKYDMKVLEIDVTERDFRQGRERALFLEEIHEFLNDGLPAHNELPFVLLPEES